MEKEINEQQQKTEKNLHLKKKSIIKFKLKSKIGTI